TVTRRSSVSVAHPSTTYTRDSPKLADLPIFLARADDSMLVPEAEAFIEFVRSEFVNHVLRSQLLDVFDWQKASLSDRSTCDQQFEAAHQAVSNVHRVQQDAESVGKEILLEPEIL